MKKSKNHYNFPLLATSFISVALLFFILGKISVKTINHSNSNLTGSCDTVTKELDLCLQDRAEISNLENMNYSLQNFGVYAPELENKNITVTNYNYKRNSTSQKTIILDENSNIYITVWEFQKGEETYVDKISPAYSVFNIVADFPVYTGYENYGNPIFISDLTKGWTKTDSITNQHNMTGYYDYNYSPKKLTSVTLNFYTQFSPNNKPILMQLSTNIKSSDFITDKNHPAILEAKNKLKNIFNSINIKK